MLAPDDQDAWDELQNQLEDVAEPEDVIVVKDLNDNELVLRFSSVREELYSLDEMVFPRTDRGRELHSIRSAILVEMSNRGLR